MIKGVTMANPFPQQDLALACIAQLEQEEAMLSATLEILRNIRAALVERNQNQLQTALNQQAHTARAASDLRDARTRLRHAIGHTLGIPPEQVTLTMLASHVSEDLASKILSRGRHLTEMARDVNAMNRSNAMLIYQSMNLLEQLLTCLTGRDDGADRYEARGQIHYGGHGPLFQARC